jgi:hypothetical protein|tara:strand:+ start:1092 stop:2240 length:1149 start_codon:yes stop_codon:yes gene_type:complete
MPILATHTQLINHAKIAMNTLPQLPILAVGGAGTGKTYLATHGMRDIWAAANNVQPEEVAVLIERCADRDAAEFAGLMMPAKDENGEVVTKSIKPDLVRKIEALRAQGYNYILLVLDEICQADSSVQKTLSSVLDRRDNTLGGHDLGAGIFVTGTGNRLKDKSGAQNILAHLKNRVLFFEMEGYSDHTVGSWIRDFAEPNSLNLLIIDCARENANELFDDTPPSNGDPMMTFRSATNVSALLTTYLEQGGDPEISQSMERLIAAAVGDRAACIIADYCENVALGVPTRNEILADPEGANVPDITGSQNSAGTLALSIATDSASTDAAIKYIVRLRPDLQVQLGARLLAKAERIGACMTSPTATSFISQHVDLIELAAELGVS